MVDLNMRRFRIWVKWKTHYVELSVLFTSGLTYFRAPLIKLERYGIFFSLIRSEETDYTQNMWNLRFQCNAILIERKTRVWVRRDTQELNVLEIIVQIMIKSTLPAVK